MAELTPETQVVARTEGVMEVVPGGTAGGDPFGVIDSRLAATAAAQSPFGVHQQNQTTPSMSVGAADVGGDPLQGPEFHIPKRTVYRKRLRRWETGAPLA